MKATLPEEIFAGGGEMGALMRTVDWSQTPLGTVSKWPQSLKTCVRILLTSRQPMFVWWGEELINLYNDAYKAIVGGKHPQALGQPASYVWREIWDQVRPRAESAILNNEGTYDEALLLIMERNGYPEETYYTFSYSPVPNDQGGTGGIICANTDDTQRIIGERQLGLLRELATRTADARTFDQACTLSASCLETNPYDLPFAMIYLVDPDKQEIFLAGTCGIERNHVAVPETVALDSDSVWPFAEVIRTQKAILVSDLESYEGNLPTGAWERSPHQAIAIPIAPSGQTGRAGILIVGLNPFRIFDDNYKGFIDLVSAQIAASIANTQAYEEERKRAEALAELDRAKTVFFSNVSHEFRTPLTLMLSPLEDALAVADDTPFATQRQSLEMVHRNGLRLLKLVNTLLDFSRIEAGRISAVYEPTDLAMFTSELASVFRSAIERAGLRLLVLCPPLLEPVYIDREMWEKIVLNLLSNAFKFTFLGEITVSLQSVGERIELSVCDTGIGIPTEELPHLFERFHRVKGAQGRTFEGSGIGLSLVQELVKLHGGTVEVRSVLGEGTCFTVVIPTGYSHLPQNRISATRTLASTALGVSPYVEEALRWLPPEEEGGKEGRREGGKEGEKEGRREGEKEALTPTLPHSLTPSLPHSHTPYPARILLADDNSDMRDYVKRLLSDCYKVETVPDGITALAAIRQHPPDLVLTDVMMPGMDGFELLRHLRADSHTREIPIILLSARAGEESRVEGLQAGADDYLVKPFSARELLARVEANLKMAQMRQEAARREQALRVEAQAAKEELESILTRIDDQFLALDHEWRYVYINDRVSQFVGMPKEEMLGKSIWELFPDTVDTLFYTEVHRAVAEQTIVQFEYFYPPWQRWFENRVYPSADGVSIFVAEITERKQAEATLRQSEERYRYLAESIPQLVWTANGDGILTDVNQRWSHFTGLTLAQAETAGWQVIVHPDDVATLSQNWAAAQQAGTIYRAEGRMRRADGVYRWHLHQAVPLKNEQDQVIKWFGTATDIEEQKQLEQQRQRVLEQEQVARTQAETANRIKDEFLAVLSHELRSPLNPILGWSKLLLGGRVDPTKTTLALQTIERNAKLQAQLIEDLLDVSRILRGKLSLNMTRVNLASTIEAAIETVQLAAQAKSIQIQIMPNPNIIEVLGDSARLQQVIWNLLSNAVKFTESGGEVRICLECINSQAKILVSDTGKGIPPDFLPYVFEYFRQADATTTRKFGGLGLGLAIVRHLVELHGGTVAAESPGEGQGATFTVSLPVLKQDKNIKDEDKSLPPKPDASPLTGIRLLVVDDEVDTRELIAFILDQRGASVTTAASGLEALQLIAKTEFDVLVSDIGMPEMDGYMLMRQIRAMQSAGNSQMRAIALTAYAGEMNQRQALVAGFQHHMAKPVDPEQLVQAITCLAVTHISNNRS
jgi:PAS domain S-box-containing protein